jgi:hypothetical protein
MKQWLSIASAHPGQPELADAFWRDSSGDQDVQDLVEDSDGLMLGRACFAPSRPPRQCRLRPHGIAGATSTR